MKLKTATLIGPALDWAVAKCEGIEVVAWWTENKEAYFVVHKDCFLDKDQGTTYGDPDDTFYPSTNWAHGGAIIERHQIQTQRGNDLYFPKGNEKGDYYEPLWIASLTPLEVWGPTPLIAALRCYVASKLGSEVDVPEELL